MINERTTQKEKTWRKKKKRFEEGGKNWFYGGRHQASLHFVHFLHLLGASFPFGILIHSSLPIGVGAFQQVRAALASLHSLETDWPDD